MSDFDASRARPGAELLAWCLDTSALADEVEPDRLVDAMTGYARFEAWASAGKAAMIAALYSRTMDHHRAAAEAERAAGLTPIVDEGDVHAGVASEICLALGISGRAADREIAFAVELASHPRLLRALADGDLDRRQAEGILIEIAVLDSATDRAAVVARLVGAEPGAPEVPLVPELRRPGCDLWGMSVGRLRSITAREVLVVDAESASRKAAAARARRTVWHRRIEHSMGELTVHAGVEATTACWTSLDLAARAAKAGGDARCLDQLRADIAFDRLTTDGCGSTGRPQVLVNLTMPVSSYLGADDRPAVLHGPDGNVALPADVARAVVDHPQGAYLRRVLTEPATGVAWDVSRRYRTPEAMRAFVAVRDGYRSRFPTSGATRLEVDHVEPFDHGRGDRPPPGPPSGQDEDALTTPANLESLGHRDHRPKTAGLLRITGDANDVLDITTMTGKRYRSYPEPYHDPMTDPASPPPETEPP